MATLEEQVLRTAKEVIVKFIEVGRVSPTGFHEEFRRIYKTVADSVNETPVKRSDSA